MSGRPTAVIRLGSLGEVVQAGAVTAHLAPVVFVTRPAWLTLAARLPGVVEVRAAGPGLDLSDVGHVIDLQGSVRSRSLCWGAPGAHRRLERADLRRRLRVWLKGRPPPPLLHRFAAAAGAPPAAGPWLQAAPAPTATVGWCLVPGAAWANKRWPAARWAALIGQLPGPHTLLGGPEDGPLLRAIAAASGGSPGIIAERGFDQTLPALAAAAGVIGGDTGLSHLARALGRPTLVLLGPTTAEDGHWTGHPHTLGRPLGCRPCGRFGGPSCPVGDHACMHEITVDDVMLAATAMLSP